MHLDPSCSLISCTIDIMITRSPDLDHSFSETTAVMTVMLSNRLSARSTDCCKRSKNSLVNLTSFELVPSSGISHLRSLNFERRFPTFPTLIRPYPTRTSASSLAFSADRSGIERWLLVSDFNSFVSVDANRGR